MKYSVKGYLVMKIEVGTPVIYHDGSTLQHTEYTQQLALTTVRTEIEEKDGVLVVRRKCIAKMAWSFHTGEPINDTIFGQENPNLPNAKEQTLNKLRHEYVEYALREHAARWDGLYVLPSESNPMLLFPLQTVWDLIENGQLKDPNNED